MNTEPPSPQGEPVQQHRLPAVSKASLARHLTQPHGTARCIVPLAELRRWRRDELAAMHAELCESGPCPSFRDSIVTKTTP